MENSRVCFTREKVGLSNTRMMNVESIRKQSEPKENMRSNQLYLRLRLKKRARENVLSSRSIASSGGARAPGDLVSLVNRRIECTDLLDKKKKEGLMKREIKEEERERERGLEGDNQMVSG